MNLTNYAIKNKVISWLVVVILLVGGVLSFRGLGQLEFPAFPIPQAMVNTTYPGASAMQVEEEVTLPLERAISQLEYVRDVESFTSAGLSQIAVILKETIQAEQQPQVWDELRRKVNDIQPRMPPGVNPSQVIDDFSDVYGILYNITSDEYTYRELQNYGEYLQRELLSIQGVKKVNLAGLVSEHIVIEIAQQDLNTLNLDPAWLSRLIQNQNMVSNGGDLLLDGQSIRIHSSGEFNEIEALKSFKFSPPGSNDLIQLGDIAEVSRQFQDKAYTLYRSNGEQAISLGISFANSVNVVDVSERVSNKLAELDFSRPIGIELNKVYDQGDAVDKSVSDFVMSLVEAVLIVIVVLLFAMGLRSGILMGAILLLTILGTFIGMSILGVEIQIISLGALIIALGMLVDNAIVITEGVLIGLKRGLTKRKAIESVVKQTQWPLLGATLIGIIAFAPIGLSADATGDFLGSLFQVLAISLLLSWVLAITLTPFFCELMFKEEIAKGETEHIDPYRGLIFTLYRTVLNTALKNRVATMVITLVLLISAVIGFGSVKQAFFPPSNTPIFYVDVWLQQGTDVRETEQRLEQIERTVSGFNDVHNVTTVVGSGAQRFILTYAPEKSYSSYGQLIVEAKDLAAIETMLPQMKARLESLHPDIDFKFKLMDLGPAPAAKVEARFYGADPLVLRQLAAQANEIMRNEPKATAVRHSWREKTQVLEPQLDGAAARRVGITKSDLDRTLLRNLNGEQIGLFRDGSHIMPIVMRAPDEERFDIDRLPELQVWSQDQSRYIPITQVVSDFNLTTEDSLIVRRNFKRVIAVMADVTPFGDDTAESLRRLVAPQIEAIELPQGYHFEWGGEYESQQKATNNLMGSLPMGYLIMFLITVLLFNTIRQPLAIWLTVPLALIGVSAGLLLMNIPFSFTALLGLLSLSGMIVKNGIVLVEQINIETDQGSNLNRAIVDASVSRVRPVCMAAITTMLGMIPLVFDAFFQSMAVTIIFGLGFATLLTLVVLPVIYALLYRVSYR
ncbi:efflux RND transporter permease subunit [Vibrio sp. 99-70-13A1]|uniref:efflux RND transporter permease subunit n=1 Tax=Vibrio sp. 99-70-13A1 TaxID=2607601 RepID=UPI001493BAEA|nr:efflux RND transporter permease subunit [Vibrio sp. 99-70-13A1]NOH97785.1 efflux RND transporter permease subunit [Vibrio sp. 99-70-13A1]